MRLLWMSPLLLTFAAGGCFSNRPVTMKLRPAGEVGTQIIKTVSGPEGEPTLEIIAGPSASTINLENYRARGWHQQSPPAGEFSQEIPAELWRDFVVRGKIKYTGPAGPGGVLLELSSGVWTGLAAYDLVELCGSGDTGWHDIELTYHGQPGNLGFGVDYVLLNLQLKLAANAGKVTVAEPARRHTAREVWRRPVGRKGTAHQACLEFPSVDLSPRKLDGRARRRAGTQFVLPCTLRLYAGR